MTLSSLRGVGGGRRGRVRARARLVEPGSTAHAFVAEAAAGSSHARAGRR